jgi:hypothetical protein
MKAAARGLCLAIALTVSGCAGEQYGQKETGGAVGGAVLGGFAGSLIGGGTGQLVSAGIGTLIGALLGSQVARPLRPALSPPGGRAGALGQDRRDCTVAQRQHMQHRIGYCDPTGLRPQRPLLTRAPAGHHCRQRRRSRARHRMPAPGRFLADRGRCRGLARFIGGSAREGGRTGQ